MQKGLFIYKMVVCLGLLLSTVSIQCLADNFRAMADEIKQNMPPSRKSSVEAYFSQFLSLYSPLSSEQQDAVGILYECLGRHNLRKIFPTFILKSICEINVFIAPLVSQAFKTFARKNFKSFIQKYKDWSNNTSSIPQAYWGVNYSSPISILSAFNSTFSFNVAIDDLPQFANENTQTTAIFHTMEILIDLDQQFSPNHFQNPFQDIRYNENDLRKLRKALLNNETQISDEIIRNFISKCYSIFDTSDTFKKEILNDFLQFLRCATFRFDKIAKAMLENTSMIDSTLYRQFKFLIHLKRLDVPKIAELCEKGYECDFVSPMSSTPLQLLLEARPNVSQSFIKTVNDQDRKDVEDLIELLIQNGAKHDLLLTPLMVRLEQALYFDSVKIMKLFWTDGTVINSPIKEANHLELEIEDMYHCIDLMHLFSRTVEFGRDAILGFFLSQGADIEGEVSDKPLIVLALDQQHETTAAILAAAGANLQQARRYIHENKWHTKIYIADQSTIYPPYYFKDQQLLKLRYIQSLFNAIEHSHEEEVLILLHLVSPLNLAILHNKEGKTPLHLAFLKNHKILAILLAYDPQLIDAINWEGKNIVEWALEAYKGSTTCFDFFRTLLKEPPVPQ